jgi:predicted permease
VPLSFKLYRILLRLYPARFREEYSMPLERQFRDEHGEAASWFDLTRLWCRTLADLATSIPTQFGSEMGQDARHTLRLWAHRPEPVILAIAALAIGIGANTGVFSVLNALLLRSLPFHEPDRVAELRGYFPVGLDGSSAALRRWNRKSNYLRDTAVFGSQDVNVAGARDSARIRLTQSSSNFFSLLGTQPVLGRAFAPDEGVPVNSAVAVIGFGLWQQLFGGDPHALGSKIFANGAPLTVVGVAAPGFDFPGKTEIWTPTVFDLKVIPLTGMFYIETIGRLRAGLSWAQARAAFEAEAFHAHPELRKRDAANRPALVPIDDQLASAIRPATLVLMGGAVLILLLACANVAGLLLARAIDRSNELLIRAAVGASPARLSQQLFTESLLLSGIAAGAGLFVAYGTAAWISQAQPAPLRAQAYTILDGRVLAFAVGLSLLTGLLFGVLPALHAGRQRISASWLRGTVSTRRAGRLHHVLVAAQVALALVLTAGSVGMGRAFLALLGTDNGYITRNAVTLSVSLAGSTLQDSDRARAYSAEALRRLRNVPGVRSASFAEYFPLTASAFMGGTFRLDKLGAPVMTPVLPVGPGFFHTMGGRILFGREFQQADADTGERLAIVNDEFARRFGDPASMPGRYITSEFAKPWGEALKIIGVTRGMWYWGIGTGPGPQVFLLSRAPNYFTLVARVDGHPLLHLPAIRAAVQSIDPKIPIFDAKTMQGRVDEALARPRFYTTAILFFGGFSLLLAVIGIFAMVSNTVARRTHEIGVRLALGTTPARVRSSMLQQSLIPVAAGALPGIAGALAAGRFLRNLLPGAEPVSAARCGIALAAICAVAVLAIRSATRRITRLDVLEILRSE